MIKQSNIFKYVFYSFLLYRFLQRHLRSCMCICTLMEFHRTHIVPCDTKVVNSASWSAIGIVNELHQEHVIHCQTIIHSKHIIIYPHISPLVMKSHNNYYPFKVIKNLQISSNIYNMPNIDMFLVQSYCS